MATTHWKADPVHSEITFKVKHLMISTTKGHLKEYEITAEADENDFSNARIIFTGQVNSISTNNEARDKHLQAVDFFDTGKYPEIKFVSGRIEKKEENLYEISGDLTIRDITQPIKLLVEFYGTAKGTEGETRAGFHVNGKLNRKDFGLSFNSTTDDGTLVVGHEVKIEADVELVRT